MKKIKFFVLTIAVMLCMTINVNADTVTNWSELKSCLEKEGNIECVTQTEIVEDNSVSGSRIKVAPGSKKLVLGKKLTVKTYIWANSGATLNVDGDIDAEGEYLFYVYPDATLNLNSGKIVSTYKNATELKPGRFIVIYGGTNDRSLPANVTVKKDVELKNGVINITDDSNAAYNINVNFAGKITNETNLTYPLIYVDGGIKNGMPKITIDEGAVINSSSGTAVYGAGNAHFIINGGEITGVTAIEIRAGKLDVLGGKITGTSKTFSTESNGSGTTVTGAGIAVSQHTTALPIEANIKGGTISGLESVYLAFLEANNNKDIVSLTIEGGTFNTDVTSYIKAGLISKKIGENYVVGKENNINLEKVTIHGEIKVDKTKAIAGEIVGITTTADEGYELKTINVVDKNGNEIEVKDNKFTMPNNEVTIKVEFIKIETTTKLPTVDTTIEVKEVVIAVKETEEIQNVLLETLNKNKELASIAEDKAIKIEVEIGTVDTTKIDAKKVEAIKKKAGNAKITNFFDITVAVKETATDKAIATLPELTKEIELMILLPEDLKNTNNKIERKYYVVREHDGKVELLDATISKDGKHLVFSSDRFSTYALAYEDNIKTNPKTEDNIVINTLLATISVLGMCGSVYYIKKNGLKN